jgi:dihydropteroate synthase
VRPKFAWQLRSRTLTLGERTLIMGVVNVTPDSFSDAGQFFDTQRAIAHGLNLLAEGADILDIGGESTRPGKKDPVTAEEECRRVLPVIEGILRQAPQAVVSVDSYRASTAEAALAAGTEIVNDVSGFTWDSQMLPFLAAAKCGCVLMHTRGRPEEWRDLDPLGPSEVLPLVERDLRRLSGQAVAAGVSRERLVLDPGFGFGKRYEENYPLLASLGQLHQLGFPLLAGTSRKSFIAKTSATSSQIAGIERLSGTLAAVTASVLEGVHLVRVHDVAAVAAAARVADAILVAAAAVANQTGK